MRITRTSTTGTLIIELSSLRWGSLPRCVTEKDIKFSDMSIRMVGVVLSVAVASAAIAQTPLTPATPATPVGTWRGTSLCLVRSSPCHDEIVVYRITPMKSPDSLSIDARRIVRGEEQEMGTLTCHLVRPSSQLTCALPQGIWYFRARNDSLTGELLLRDNTRFRDVRTIRAP